MSKVKQLKNDTIAVCRGIKKAYDVAISVGEALAWGGLLATAYTILHNYLKGDLALSDPVAIAVSFSAFVITLRVLVEGAKYFKQIGSVEEK